MREAELTYYFQHLEEFPVPQAFSGHTYAYEALLGLKAVMAVLLPKGCGQEILGEVMENATILGDVHIGKGTVVHPGVVIEGPSGSARIASSWRGPICAPTRWWATAALWATAANSSTAFSRTGQRFSPSPSPGTASSANRPVGSAPSWPTANSTRQMPCSKLTASSSTWARISLAASWGTTAASAPTASLLPGAHIGPYTWIMPGTRVKGFVAERLRVSARQELEITPNEALDLK